MADRPIIFSAPMVRALLDGKKSQTRRLINPQPPENVTSAGVIARSGEGQTDEWSWLSGDPTDMDSWGFEGEFKTRYRPGDRLYVREAAWIAPPGWTDSPANPMGPQRQEVAYRADDRSGYTASAAADYKLRLYPSIHMPRWASRLTLTVEDVRVGRLQAISEGDAMAEGVHRIFPEGSAADTGPNRYTVAIDGGSLNAPTARDAFKMLWETLHGPDSWAANPFVVALTFRVERGNIDTLSREAA